MITNLHSMYNYFRDDGIIFCFSGPISQAVVEGIGETLRQKMEIEDASQTVTQKVFSIFVEQMQNVLNYSADVLKDEPDQGDLRAGILVVGARGDSIYLQCGNTIRNEHVAGLQSRLEELHGMDKEQLKAVYKEKRRNAAEAGSKGAGLGLIDIARKATQPIDFGFTRVDDARSFFSIEAVIAR